MIKRCIVSLAISLLVLPSLQAQRTLSLEECRRLAIDNNKTLAQSRLNQEVAEYTQKAAKTNYLPKLSATAGYMRSGKEFSILNKEQKNALTGNGTALVNGFGQTAQQILQQNPTLAPLIQQLTPILQSVGNIIDGAGQRVVDAFRTDNRNMAAGAVILTQPLYMGGKIRAYDKITRYQQDLANEKLRGDEQEVLLQTDQAYWQVVSLANKHKLATSYRNTLKKLDDDVQKMIREGVATKANGLQIAVKLNEAEMLVTKVEDGLALSRMLLCQLCGLPLGEQVTTEDETKEDLKVSNENATPDVEIAFNNRPELCHLQTAQNIYDEKINIVCSEFLPQVALLAGYGLTYPNAYNSFEKKFRGDWHVGITLKVPLWSWGEGRYKVRAAKAEAAITTLRATEVREKIELQVNQETFRVNEANKKLMMAQKNLEQANENLRVATLGYKEGVITMTDVLSAETAWLQAHSEKIDAEIDCKLTQTSLQKALGTLN